MRKTIKVVLSAAVLAASAGAVQPAGATGVGNYNGGTCTLHYFSANTGQSIVAETYDAPSGTNCLTFYARAFRGSTYSSWVGSFSDAFAHIDGTSGSPQGGNHIGCTGNGTNCGSTKTS